MSEVERAGQRGGDSERLGGKYRLGRRISAGGATETFRGELVGPDGFRRPVVINQLRAELARDPAIVGRYVEEARRAGRLSHAHVVAVLDFGRAADGRHFVVVEALEGVDAGRVLQAARRRRRPIPPEIALAIVGALLRALDHAHRRRDALAGPRAAGPVVHGAIAPPNVLLSWDGQVKLGGFGVAGPARAAGWETFLAPEQVRGGRATTLSDLFSVGVLLYELLTGAAPYPGSPDSAARSFATPPPPSALVAGLPGALDAVVMQGIAPGVAARFPDADAFLSALLRACVPALVPATAAGIAAGLTRLGPFPDRMTRVTPPLGVPLSALPPERTPALPPARTPLPKAEEGWQLGTLQVAPGEWSAPPCAASRHVVLPIFIAALGGALGVSWWLGLL